MKIIPTIFLFLSITSLGLSIFLLIDGSKKSQIYNQMKNAKVVSSNDELIKLGTTPFLLQAYINFDHESKNGMVAYNEFKDNEIVYTYSPVIRLKLLDGYINLKPNYSLADFNINILNSDNELKGIKTGVDVTIYGVQYSTDDFKGVKGYELYPGTSKQYLEFLESPHVYYMIYVRFLITIALILFLCSLVINIKK